MVSPEKAKETTILGLSEEIGTQLSFFQSKLDGYFARHCKPDSQAEPRRENPNILDEIIDTLERDKACLGDIVNFISSDVLPKIK